jgi:hypothetical protein
VKKKQAGKSINIFSVANITRKKRKLFGLGSEIALFSGFGLRGRVDKVE